MNTFRKIVTIIATPLVSIFLLIAVILLSLTVTVGKPITIKQWLGDSGMYPALAETAVKEIADSTISVDNQSVSLDRPEVRAGLQQAITPAFTESAIENVLDGTYVWLQGTTSKPEYAIDIAPLKSVVIDGLAQSARARLARLPACSLTAVPTTIDPFTITCQPPALLIELQIAKLRQDLSNNNQLLPDATITADTTLDSEKLAAGTATNSSEQPWYQQAEGLPAAYRWTHLGPWIFGALAAGLGIVIIFAARTKRHGLRLLAGAVLGSGIVLSLVGGIGILLSHNSTVTFDPNTATAALQTAAVAVARLATDAIGRIQLWWGLGFVVIGVTGLIVLRVTAPKSEPKHQDPVT